MDGDRSGTREVRGVDEVGAADDVQMAAIRTETEPEMLNVPGTEVTAAADATEP